MRGIRKSGEAPTSPAAPSHNFHHEARRTSSPHSTLDRCVSIHPIAAHSTPVISTRATITIKPMFVRWKIRCLRRSELDGQPAGRVRYAVLVESVRREGKPRQKVLCHLAHIRERHIGSALRRAAFWQAVDRRLMLLNLDAPARAVIESKLAVIAPRPTTLELEEMRRKFVAGRARKT